MNENDHLENNLTKKPFVSEKMPFNIWKYAFFVLAAMVLLFIAYELGRANIFSLQSSNSHKNTPQIEPAKPPTLVEKISKKISNEKLILELKGAASDFSDITDWLNFPPESTEGKTILLVFCTPTLDNSFCSAIVPYLKKWDQKYKDQGLQLIWINSPYPVHTYDANTYRSKSVAFMEKYSLNFPIGQDPSNILSEKYDLIGWPEFFLIDKNGLYYSVVGYPSTPFAKYDYYEEAITQVLEK